MDNAGDINAIMNDAPAPSSRSGGGSAATGTEYDIWYFLKILLVIFLIIAVFNYFMDKRKQAKDQDEEGYKPKRRKRK